MLKRIAIILGSIILAALAIGVLFIYATGGTSLKTVNNLNLRVAHLSKSKESYARCYNSINHGTVLITNVRFQIKSDNFYDDSITFERLDAIEESFMGSVKQQCKKTIDDYRMAYEKAIKDQEETQSFGNVIWNIFHGSTQGQQSTQDLSIFEPSRARMEVAFNDYVFTERQVMDYFINKLGL